MAINIKSINQSINQSMISRYLLLLANCFVLFYSYLGPKKELFPQVLDIQKWVGRSRFYFSPPSHAFNNPKLTKIYFMSV